MAVLGQTIASVIPTRRTRNLARKYTALIGEMILNKSLLPKLYLFVLSNEYIKTFLVLYLLHLKRYQDKLTRDVDNDL